MARTKKRYLETPQIEEIQKNSPIIYHAGIYVRLSHERTETYRNKSSSISIQEEVCIEFAKEKGIAVEKTYCDYEYTGTNFERPAFKEMMQDIKNRKINCIIVKDMSRFGREYLQIGNYIEKVFPFLGVRFISVNDHFDTIDGCDNKKNFEIVIKNLINDMYSKDISTKVKTTKITLAKNGFFIGTNAAYGYKVKKVTGGRKLEIDENTAPVVKQIFKWSLEGDNQIVIARRLNEIGYTTAATYNKTGRMYQHKGDYQWRKGTVDNILVARVYTGALVQGVKSQSLSQGKNQEILPKDEWIVIENAHETIISKEDFEKVQQERLNRKQKREELKREKKLHSKLKTITGIAPENRYKNLIFEKATGFQIPRHPESSGIIHKRISYVFDNNRSDGQIYDCHKIRLKEETLDQLILQLIREQLQNISGVEEFKQKIELQGTIQLEKYQKEKDKFYASLDKKQLFMQKLYEKYVKGEIKKSEYLSYKDNLISEIEEIKKDIFQNDTKEKDLEYKKKEAIKWIELLYFASEKTETKLSRELLVRLIERIEVGENNHLDIKFRFAPAGLDRFGGDLFGE